MVGEEEEENGDPIAACFPKQEVQEGVTNNHEEMGNDTVTHEGNDNWGKPYWFDKWHPCEENPVTVSDAMPYKYIETTDSMAELDLHMVDDELEARKMRMSDLDITLWSDRGHGRAKLVVYHRR